MQILSVKNKPVEYSDSRADGQGRKQTHLGTKQDKKSDRSNDQRR